MNKFDLSSEARDYNLTLARWPTDLEFKPLTVAFDVSWIF